MRAVLDALLDKYKDEGIKTLENTKVLKSKEFAKIGTPIEIVTQIFGSKEKYEDVVAELEDELFRDEESA